MANATVDKAEERHAQLLASCGDEDFINLEKLGFLQAGHGMVDKSERPVVMIAAHLYPAKAVKRDRLLKFICSRLDALVQEPYTIVWLHTQATYWNNCPSVFWLWSTWEWLPARYRANLAQLHVVHCDLSLWTASMWIGPWLSSRLWHKINWVSRLEFLWEHVDKESVAPHIPEYVMEHDSLLEEQPLADYGFLASKELLAQVPGAPSPPL